MNKGRIPRQMSHMKNVNLPIKSKKFNPIFNRVNIKQFEAERKRKRDAGQNKNRDKM